MEGRIEDDIEGQEDRKTAQGGWISIGLGKGKNRDQNMVTGEAEVGQQIGQVRG